MSVLCGIFLKKICGPHKHQIHVCGNMVENCLKPTTPSPSTGVRTHGWWRVPFCWQSKILIEIGQRNTNNIKIAIENASLCRKICNMRTLLKCAKYAAIAYSHKTDMLIKYTVFISKIQILIVFCTFKILFHHYYIVCCYVARHCAHLHLSGRLAVCQPVLSVLKYDWTIVKQSTIRDLLQVARVQLLSSLYRPPVTDKSSTSNCWSALALLVKPDCKSQHGWRYWLLLKSAVDWYLETALLLPPENNVELESGLGR